MSLDGFLERFREDVANASEWESSSEDSSSSEESTTTSNESVKSDSSEGSSCES